MGDAERTSLVQIMRKSGLTLVLSCLFADQPDFAPIPVRNAFRAMAQALLNSIHSLSLPRLRHVRQQSARPDPGTRGRVRRLPLRRHARRASPRHLPGPRDRRVDVRGRQDVRRLLDHRLEGHQRVGHGAAARSGYRPPRSVQRARAADPALRRAGAAHDAGLRPRPALDRQARRGVPEIHRHRRHRVLRAGAGILHLRLGALAERSGPRVLRDRFRGSGVVVALQVRRQQHRPPSGREGRLLPGQPGRFAG